ncbi:MAG: type II toxin-antitoxin system VapC family toxin [Thermoguttaceae bacterium]|nr:type II toxin-antitoxin system VapC family toxin [Thermoguttaceae bacterium]
MRLLLDTHAFLWFVTNDSNLSEAALEFVAEPTNEVLVSPASCWEIAIKVSLGKYLLTAPFEKFFREGIEENDMAVLPIDIRHAAVLSSLPMHHKDPFDRMMVSQAIAEQIPIVSRDASLDAYGVRRLW